MRFCERKDSFMVDEIEGYGLFLPMTGIHAEQFIGGGGKSITHEYVFQLKDGKRIAFDRTSYTRWQRAELFEYI